MQTIKVYDKDAEKLLSILTYDKFKGKKVEDIINWILKQDEVVDIIHNKKDFIPEWIKEAKCQECFQTIKYKSGAKDCTGCAYL
jgi:hypothetical protein